MKKIIFLLLFIGCSMFVDAQNKQVLYGFDKIPQTLLLNPGGETTYKYHLAIPFLSGISANGNISGVTIADVFRDKSIGIFSNSNFNVRFRNAIDKLDANDYAYINAQVEILSGGYKLNSKDYISFGFYTEADAFISMPKDVFTLINEGNAAYLGRSFSISQVNMKADVLGVLHAGISRRFNDRLTVGARLKIYSGSKNIISTKNKGTFTTQEGQTGIYEHTLNNVDAGIYSSGIYNENNEVAITGGKAFGGAFLGGNFGLGLDIGFTSYINEQIQFSASLLDIGFISYSKDTRNFITQGNYTFSGVDFLYDNQNTNYWNQLKQDFETKVSYEDNRESYTVMRPIKFNGSVRYSYGKSRYESNCHDISFKDFYDNSVGGQLYAIWHPIGPRFAFTGFYERKFSKHLNTKVTYTIDDFSYTNFGIGLSMNIWKLNIYGTVDNIFELTDIADAHRASFQFGINLIYN